MRCWRRFLYGLGILLLIEILLYCLTGYIAKGYQEIAFRKFNEMMKEPQGANREIPYAAFINTFARQTGVNARLVAGVIQAESSFQPKAVSRTGAVGLMQVMPGTWREINQQFKVCSERHEGECTSACFFDPETNIHVGTLYLAQLLQRYQGNAVLALAAYNAGPGAVSRQGGIPQNGETVEYVERVMKYCSKNNAAMESVYQWQQVQNHIWRWIIITLCVITALGGVMWKRRRLQWRRW